MSGKLRRVIIASVVGISQRASAALAALFIFPQVLHTVGVVNFGLWGVAASLSMIINFADFGLGPMLIARISRDLADGDQAAARRSFGAAFSGAVLIALALMALALAMLGLPVPGIEAQILVIVVAGVAVNVPLGIANPAWIAVQRGWMAALWEFVQTIFFVGGLLLCARYSHDVRLFSACIYLAIVLSNACNIVLLLATRRELRPERFPAHWAQIRALVPASARFFALSMLDALSYLLDPFLALQVVGALAAAQMAVVQRIAVAATGVLMILSQYLWPTYVEALVRRDMRWVHRSLIASVVVTGGAALGTSVVLGEYGPQLCRVWLHKDIGFTGMTFGLLGGWIFVMGLARALATVLNALQDLAFQMRAFAGFIAVSFALKLILPRWFGVDGILIAVIVTAGAGLIPALALRLRAQLEPYGGH